LTNSRKMIIMFNKYLFILLISNLFSTFSIVAIDTETGEVGSAGGSCIAGSIIISDIHPGVGAIHTQSYYLPANQNYASDLMDQGYTPNQIINNLVLNDVQNNPGIRQYGVISFQNGGESASYTGENCSDWKGHLNETIYAIQGNILLNSSILDSMESRFINTNGPLSHKLMAALQGAKVPGADSRCLDEGISTYSAFIRVAQTEDTDNYYIDLNVNSVIPYFVETNTWIDPIDTLQILYDNWYESSFEYEFGDVNQDFIINILDIIIIMNAVLGDNISGTQFYLADINSDNIIDIQDIIIIINIILT